MIYRGEVEWMSSQSIVQAVRFAYCSLLLECVTLILGGLYNKFVTYCCGDELVSGRGISHISTIEIYISNGFSQVTYNQSDTRTEAKCHNENARTASMKLITG